MAKMAKAATDFSIPPWPPSCSLGRAMLLTEKHHKLRNGNDLLPESSHNAGEQAGSTTIKTAKTQSNPPAALPGIWSQVIGRAGPEHGKKKRHNLIVSHSVHDRIPMVAIWKLALGLGNPSSPPQAGN